MMDDFARRTITAMRSSLAAYGASADVMSLNLFIGQLSIDMDSLTGHVDEDWLNEMRSAWWPLEFVNAMVLDGDRRHLTASEVEAVATARDEFLALLTEY